MRILFAEDDRDLSRAVKALLEHSGYSVDVVDNGLDAVDYAESGGYDGLIRLTFYDPVTGEKAAVDAEIPVQVTVRETFAETEAP